MMECLGGVYSFFISCRGNKANIVSEMSSWKCGTTAIFIKICCRKKFGCRISGL